ncbi:hypothetical protein Ahy_B03g062931 [Arachis hypogaea]|uniref:R13L1/DRL21-like LRR repeat region domain-containing protein n=1 Tax=Arachis hypogaea TaxID=3818 RepID=A0A444ZVY4_ARAHY|nr:hypothetical protein Ahy_B03g062931 [Arachis hypogaea]
MDTTSSTAPPSPPRVRGMLDSLIEYCHILEGSQAFANVGLSANHFIHRLLTLQSCLRDNDRDPQQHCCSKVMDLSYDLETLFEDIELQQHVGSSYSSDPPFWSQLLATQHKLVHQGSSSTLYGTSQRLASMLKLLDQLVNEIKPFACSLPLPKTQIHVIVQKPQIGNNYHGLKQLIHENQSPSSSVGFDDNHGCVLRYLDLSNNPLKELPDSLTNLLRLQTLKILQTYITSLPKNLYKMVNLRHFCTDSGMCFEFVPPYIGRLVSLQTFEDFVVNRQNGCKIIELKDLNNLRGKLCIRQLENVTSCDEAQQARLYLKKHLTWLRLCWSESDILDVDVNFDVIEFLQPHHNLQLLEIYGYLNSTFPRWISDPSFNNLSSITLEECVCEQLPEFGVLPSLRSLRISVVTGVNDIYESFYGHGKVKVGFPSLCTLYVSFMLDLETWFGFANGDLPKLEKLHIISCPELKHLPEMKNLSMLNELVIEECTKLNSLPKNGLPGNVKLLRIHHCPDLAKKCRREVGTDWKKISHIPSIDV